MSRGPRVGSLGEEQIGIDEQKLASMLYSTLARRASVESLHRLSSTLEQTCALLLAHFNSSEDVFEEELLDDLLTSVGSAFVAVRLERFRATSPTAQLLRPERPETQSLDHEGSRDPEKARRLSDFVMGVAHGAQWDATELCYGWLVDWEDAEVHLEDQQEQLIRALRTLTAELGKVVERATNKADEVEAA